jgi:hypothetical protein
MKNLTNVALICLIAVLASCSSTQYTYSEGYEDDEIYFASSDPDEYDYSSYVNENEPASAQDDYYVQDYYGGEGSTDVYDDGGDTYITNNYYDSWSPRFSPWYSYSPYSRPRPYNSGWYVGWNSFSGWQGGYNWGWNNPYYSWNYGWNYYGSWYGNSWGWNDPWGCYAYNPYYGYGSPYGYGYNSAYYNGYNDALGYSGNGYYYGHRTPVSTGSTNNSAYNEGAILVTAQNRDGNVSYVGTNRPNGDVSMANEKPSADPQRNDGSSVSNATSRPSETVNTGSTQNRPAQKPQVIIEPPVSSTSRPGATASVNDDYVWAGPSRAEPTSSQRPTSQNSSARPTPNLNDRNRHDSSQGSRGGNSGSAQTQRPSGNSQNGQYNRQDNQNSGGSRGGNPSFNSGSRDNGSGSSGGNSSNGNSSRDSGRNSINKGSSGSGNSGGGSSTRSSSGSGRSSGGSSGGGSRSSSSSSSSSSKKR